MLARASTSFRRVRASSRPIPFLEPHLEHLEERRLLAAYAIADYMPLFAGDQWTYAGTLNGAPATAVATLGAGGTLSGFSTSKLSTVISPTDGSASSRDVRYFAHTGTGLRLFRQDVDEPGLMSTLLFGAGARLATISISDGVSVHVTKSLTGSSSDGRSWTGTFIGNLSVAGLENIVVGAGSFEALRISLIGSVSENGSTGWTASGTIAETRWLVRGVGAVRVDYAMALITSDAHDHSFRYNLGLTGATRLRGVASTIVRGRRVDVAYNDSFPTTVDGTNFAGVDVNGQLKTRVFTITNTTTHPITLAPGSQGYITLGGPDVGEFVVVRQPARTLQPGQTTPFSVRFDPSTTGFRYATVSFATTETGAEPFQFDIRGTGILLGTIQVLGPQSRPISNGAQASTAVGTVFGSAAAAGSRRIQRVFTIVNTGPGSLVLTSSSRVVISGADGVDFSVTLLPSGTIAPGGSTIFKISFDPSALGARSAVVSILSNDRFNSIFSFSILGTGV
jgi:hypothetical protein